MRSIVLVVSFFITSCIQSQDKPAGGPCEGCEAIYEYGGRLLNPTDTIPGFDNAAEKLMVTGIIYKNDGETPASDVILYIYHTNEYGVYQPSENPQGWGRRHGQHRGWIKTAKDGRYTFYTFRPASYPDNTIPQHIHAIVKEIGYGEYYIDDYLFTDDPKLTAAEIENQQRRGGSGIITPKKQNGMLMVQRDIVLGENIPGY